MYLYMDTVTGFNNIGAICWFNSLLQAIISCKSLCQILDTGVVETDSTSNTAKELSILIYKLKELDDVQNLTSQLFFYYFLNR
jgi:ubiquitin C-terminal hydrolase